MFFFIVLFLSDFLEQNKRNINCLLTNKAINVMITKLVSRLNFTSTLVAATFFLFSTNSFADIKDIKLEVEEMTIGASIPNIKTVNGLGTAIDLVDFTFVSHGGDQSQKIDFLTPSIFGKFYNNNKDAGFELNVLNGSDTSSVSLDGTVGAANYLDIIPVSGVASPGAFRTDVVSTLSVKQQINNFSLMPFKKLELSSVHQNFSFLKDLNPEVGFLINRTAYKINVTDPDALYYLKESVTSTSFGPVLSIYKERKLNESNNDTKIVLGSKIALLYTRENLDAYNGGNVSGTINHYQASDSDKHLSGMLSFTAGLVKKNDQGGNFFILGSVNIANDVSSIKNPRCSTGQNCNDATYVATVTPAHLERQTTISPSIKIGYKKTF